MLVIPITSKLKEHKRPLITIALIALNCFVYFFLQGDENEQELAAYEYYDSSGLMNMEIRAYEQYLLTTSQIGSLPDPVQVNSDPDTRLMFYIEMRSNEEFITRLRNDEIIKAHDAHFLEWKKLRTTYEEKIDRIFSHRFGYIPSKGGLLTAFTCTFLHADFMHLFGNMVFLWLIGCMVETVISRRAYLSGYLLTGVLATLTYGFINSASTGPLVGASGAISGIMGAYCVLYGTRKIKVFVTTGFYFNNFRLPAIVLLPFWLGKELYQFVTMGDVSNVAFMAHFGGMAAGAVLAFVHVRIKGPITLEDLEEQVGSLNRDLEEGVRYMAELEVGKAREIFNRLLITHPDNHDVLEKLFEVEKLDPRPSSLHPTAARYLALMVKNVEFEYNRLLDTFNRYIELSSKDLRLPPNLLFSLLIIFCKKGDLNEAIAVVSTLIKKHGAHPKTPRALLHLAIAGDKNKMIKVRNNCYTLLQRKFPNSPEYARACEILDPSAE